MTIIKKQAVILLSGGLDSFVSLDIARKDYEIKLALTFDYGQKAFEEELFASKEIVKYYGIEHRVINLPFLDEIKGQNIWVPNRNGLFINIAGCFCDAFNYDAIIFGGNLEEAQEFPDNSESFAIKTQECLEYSTRNHPKIISPLINMTKLRTIQYAIENDLHLEFIKSCYESKNKIGKKHCGKCPSCLKLKKAIIETGNDELLKKLDF